MQRTHRIRLRGPWGCQWLGESGRGDRPASFASPPQSLPQVVLPNSWIRLFGTARGRAQFYRRFGRPTNLGARERVYLVFEAIGGDALISVNGNPLGRVSQPTGTTQFDITEFLADNNVVAVDVQFDPEIEKDNPGGLWAPVVLEIRS